MYYYKYIEKFIEIAFINNLLKWYSIPSLSVVNNFSVLHIHIPYTVYYLGITTTVIYIVALKLFISRSTEYVIIINLYVDDARMGLMCISPVLLKL